MKKTVNFGFSIYYADECQRRAEEKKVIREIVSILISRKGLKILSYFYDYYFFET